MPENKYVMVLYGTRPPGKSAHNMCQFMIGKESLGVFDTKKEGIVNKSYGEVVSGPPTAIKGREGKTSVLVTHKKISCREQYVRTIENFNDTKLFGASSCYLAANFGYKPWGNKNVFIDKDKVADFIANFHASYGRFDSFEFLQNFKIDDDIMEVLKFYVDGRPPRPSTNKVTNFEKYIKDSVSVDYESGAFSYYIPSVLLKKYAYTTTSALIWLFRNRNRVKKLNEPTLSNYILNSSIGKRMKLYLAFCLVNYKVSYNFSTNGPLNFIRRIADDTSIGRSLAYNNFIKTACVLSIMGDNLSDESFPTTGDNKVDRLLRHMKKNFSSTLENYRERMSKTTSSDSQTTVSFNPYQTLGKYK